MLGGMILVVGNQFEEFKKDNNGNSLRGKILINGSKNYLRSESRLVVGIELNILVVETNDAILISSYQKLKELVNELDQRNYPEARIVKSFRPWGSFTNIEQGGSCVKREITQVAVFHSKCINIDLNIG